MQAKFIAICLGICTFLGAVSHAQTVQSKQGLYYSDSTINSLYVSLSRNFKFPAQARRMETEGTALFRFELAQDGSIKSIGSENDLGKTFRGYFKSAINKVPVQTLMNLRRKAQDSVFVLPVTFVIKSKLNASYDSSFHFLLKPLVVRSISIQRMRVKTTHGYLIKPGEESMYYDLDEAIKNKKSIQGLSLVRKNLSEFPKPIQKMGRIKYLDLESNSLREIPESIENLEQLEELYLYNNKIEIVSVGLSKLSKIRKLVISNNNLNTFPEAVIKLNNLELLDLSNNGIRVIPPQISQMSQLRFLYLENNNIENVPIEIFDLPHLEKVYLQGNPLSEKDITQLRDRFKNIELVL